MAALLGEAGASMGAIAASTDRKNAGLAPAFSCPSPVGKVEAGTLNYKCSLIALPEFSRTESCAMACARTLVLGLLALGAAGCAAVAPRPAKAPNEGSASYRRVDNGGMAHYQLAIGDTATGGKAIQRVLPQYPPAMLAACPPVVDVQAQVIVDTAGKASEVRRFSRRRARRCCSGRSSRCISAVGPRMRTATRMKWTARPSRTVWSTPSVSSAAPARRR